MGKASVSDADAFRDALMAGAADFKSTRGDFAFAPNHHPIQDIYVRAARWRRVRARTTGAGRS